MTYKIFNYDTFDIIIKLEYININIDNMEELETILKDIFKKINDIFNIKIEGYYNIDAYYDINYGIIFHIEKENLEYYNYFKGQIDMKIIIHKTIFYYEVEDYILKEKTKLHIKNNKLYITIETPLTLKEKLYLQENSKIKYFI